MVLWIFFWVDTLTRQNLSMMPAEHLWMETWDEITVRKDPALRDGVTKGVSLHFQHLPGAKIFTAFRIHGD